MTARSTGMSPIAPCTQTACRCRAGRRWCVSTGRGRRRVMLAVRQAETLHPNCPLNQRENALREEKPNSSATAYSGRSRFSMKRVTISVRTEVTIAEKLCPSRAGYKVLAAASSAEGLDIASRHGVPIHLLLTDIVMPRMSGLELAERLRPVHAGMRVLYMSGYAAEAIAERHGLERAAYLSKPFTLDELTRSVRELLDRELDA